MDLKKEIMSKKKEIAQLYIDLLAQANTTELVKLFSKNGFVDSPIYGEMEASTFYPLLNSDTANSELKLKGIFEDNDTNTLAIYFNFKWTIKNNEIVTFDVVDIIEFDEEHKIQHLKIIYDTVQSRVLINELRK